MSTEYHTTGLIRVETAKESYCDLCWFNCRNEDCTDVECKVGDTQFVFLQIEDLKIENKTIIGVKGE